jgi:hypothetical protein
MAPTPAVRVVLLAALCLPAVACSGDADPVAAPPAATASPAPTTPAAPAPEASAPPVPPPPAMTGSAPSDLPTTLPPGGVPVPDRVVPTLPEVPLTAPAPFGTGVVVRMTGARAGASAGSGPGQLAGAAAVAFSLTLENGTAQPVGLDLANVAVRSGPDGDPGLPVEGPPAAPFRGVLAAGASATAVYVFVIAPEQRDRVVLSVGYAPDAPLVELTGSVP